MTMPKYHELFTAVLKVLRVGETRKLRDVQREVADGLGLSEEERSETMSGGGNRAENRVYWSSLFLKQAGAIERPHKGYVQITPFGRQLLSANPSGVTLEALEATEGLQAWYTKSRAAKKSKTGLKEDGNADSVVSDQTPDELIATAHEELSNSTASELIDLLHGEHPEFLEHAVLKVLHAMGYGNNIGDLQHLGRSGDGGVDGVINQDRLGLDQIYVQAKRHDPARTISRPDIQSFVGAVTGKKATRGIYITTSRFSNDARAYAMELGAPRIILIDGDGLAKLMLEHEIGVTVERTYKVYRIDENFFDA